MISLDLALAAICIGAAGGFVLGWLFSGSGGQ